MSDQSFSLSSGHAARSLLAYGDSLTAGYGLATSDSFAAQLERALCADGCAVNVHNAGVSGNTTADGLGRLPRTLASLRARPDLTILALGANDMLRLVDPRRTRANLEQMIEELVRLEFPLLLVGMKAPFFFDRSFRQGFEGIFPALADKYGIPLYPFFLEGLLLDPSLNLPDGLHPNAKGVAVMVRGILPLVKRALVRETV